MSGVEIVLAALAAVWFVFIALVCRELMRP